MSQEYISNLMALQERAKADEYYLSLLREYRQLDKTLLHALEEMAPAHRNAVMDYLGSLNALNARLLELSLSSQGKS